MHAIKYKYIVYGRKVGFVTDPYEQPDRNVMKPIPTAMIDMNGKGTQAIEKLPDGTKAETQVWSNLRQEDNLSVLPFAEKHCKNAQSMVHDNQAGCAPENIISSCYKGKNNFAGRTELDSESDIGEVVCKTKFS